MLGIASHEIGGDEPAILHSRVIASHLRSSEPEMF